jgi:HSP20 family protein
MNIFKRQPLSTLPQLPLFSQLSEEMNHFFDRDLSTLGTNWPTLGGQWKPAIDIEKTDKEYVIRADIPGVDAEDINVSMENNMLVIEGRRETKAEKNEQNYHCVERNYGSFYRAIGLPEAVDSAKIRAHNHNGVLEVKVPKSAGAKQKVIPVLAD